MKEIENEKLYKIRHSLAHIMAQAVLSIRPDTQLGFGPPVENGFYYDFLFTEPITNEDLKAIEKKMKHIIKQNQKFEYFSKSVDEAVAYLNEMNQPLKAEYAKELGEQHSEIGFFTNGEFVDMCEGPHIESTKELPAACFKLDSIAGSYWRGDSDNVMLTRIYGLAFESREDLEQYVRERKLAMERDHRKLGKELELYIIDEEIGAGLPIWLPNGAVLREELEAFAKDTEFMAGYKRVATPHITKESLFYKSGHLPYYSETMYKPIEIEEDNFYLKPMNCPFHHKVFASRPRSYRELPLRIGEYSTCYRFEHSGALSGLLRVRGLHMNDGHIYCSMEQAKEEFKNVLQMHVDYYNKFRITNFWTRLSLRARDNSKFIGNTEIWDQAEQIIKECLDEVGLEYKAEEGEAAFYGPKVDFQIRNVIGREETASTNQIDYVAADRFGLEFTGADGEIHKPVVIHRAPLGTHERFIAFLIEHFGGAFPTWMAPVQVKLIPISDNFMDYAKKLQADLFKNRIRVEIDDSSDSFNKKIRKAVTAKTPNMFILGEKEMENQAVTWRRYCVKEQQTLKFEDALKLICHMRDTRFMDNFEDNELPEVSS
jgi:threonyl-tRNA synthetase